MNQDQNIEIPCSKDNCTLDKIVDHGMAGVLDTFGNRVVSSISAAVLCIFTFRTGHVRDSRSSELGLLLLVPFLLLRMRLLVEFGLILLYGRDDVRQNRSCNRIVLKVSFTIGFKEGFENLLDLRMDCIHIL